MERPIEGTEGIASLSILDRLSMEYTPPPLPRVEGFQSVIVDPGLSSRDLSPFSSELSNPSFSATDNDPSTEASDFALHETLQSSLNIHDKSPTPRCFECGSTSSLHWYTSPSGKAKSWCSCCYMRAHNRSINSEGHRCVVCGTTWSSQWRSDGNGNENARCNACYQRARQKKINAEGQLCVGCGATSSSYWYSSPDGKPKSWCRACYMRARRRKKRQAKKKQIEKKRKAQSSSTADDVSRASKKPSSASTTPYNTSELSGTYSYSGTTSETSDFMSSPSYITDLIASSPISPASARRPFNGRAPAGVDRESPSAMSPAAVAAYKARAREAYERETLEELGISSSKTSPGGKIVAGLAHADASADGKKARADPSPSGTIGSVGGLSPAEVAAYKERARQAYMQELKEEVGLSLASPQTELHALLASWADLSDYPSSSERFSHIRDAATTEAHSETSRKHPSGGGGGGGGGSKNVQARQTDPSSMQPSIFERPSWVI